MLTRRGVVAGALAFGLLPAARAAQADVELHAALDAILDDAADPAARLATLRVFRAEDLSRSAVLDLDTVRFGLELDVRIAAASGPTRYALQLERELGLALVPDRALHWLERASRKLHSRADVLLRSLGYARGTVGSRFLALASDPRARQDNDEQQRDATVVYMNQCVQRSLAPLDRDFSPVPDWCRRVDVRRLSPGEVLANTQGYRVLPTPTSAGAYVVDLRDLTRRPRWTLPSVVHHELLPGHLLQLPLEAAVGAYPRRRPSRTTAFSRAPPSNSACCTGCCSGCCAALRTSA